MTDILCNWLNRDIFISKVVDESNFAHLFSSGYLIGEVLYTYGLQQDFTDHFSQNNNIKSKLNNFMRIEPELRLLNIPFSVNTAKDIIKEKPGVATQLLYRLYIALKNKAKANLTNVAMETMKPSANAKLDEFSSKAYKKKLLALVPRQADEDIKAIGGKFENLKTEVDKSIFKERFENMEKYNYEVQKAREEGLEQIRKAHKRTADICSRIQNAVVHIPTVPEQNTLKAYAQRKEARKHAEIQKMQKDIENFEEKIHQTMLLANKKFSDEEITVEKIRRLNRIDNQTCQSNKEMTDRYVLDSSDSYMEKIKKRLQEDATAREEKEKRRRKVLIDQMKAHQAKQEVQREEQLVATLMRQTQEERRIAVQLMQVRREKQVMRENRIYRERQYEERRKRDFEEALDYEAEMAHLAKIEYASKLEEELSVHKNLLMERSLARYNKHYDICSTIAFEIISFSCKVAEYRELTNLLVPEKLVKEWISTFISGLPLFGDDDEVDADNLELFKIQEEARQQLLDNQDFDEYKSMSGAWVPVPDGEHSGPPAINKIFRHILETLYAALNKPVDLEVHPELPSCPIKAVVFGKMFSGKTSCIQRICQEKRIECISIEQLIKDAVQAHNHGEVRGIVAPLQEPSKASLDKENVEEKELEKSEKNIEENDNTQNIDSTDKNLTIKTDPGETLEIGEEKSQFTISVTNKSLSAASIDVESAHGDSNYEKTPRATLGAKVLKVVNKGKEVDDHLMIDILMEYIRRIPEGTGWILDGFPLTYNQTKLLEKAMSGLNFNQFDSEQKHTSLVSLQKSKKSLGPELRSSLNVAIVLDIDDELCIRRSLGRYCGLNSNEMYQVEFHPPPSGAFTGVGNVEQIVPVQDNHYNKEQLQQRIASFNDGFKKIEKWFKRFGTLYHVDASGDQENTYDHVTAIIDDTINSIQQKQSSDKIEVKEEMAATPDLTKSSTCPPVESDEIFDAELISTHKESMSSFRDEKIDGTEKSLQQSKSSKDKKGAKEKSTKSLSPPVPLKKISQRLSSEAVQVLEDATPPPPPPPIKPDSDEWEIITIPINEDLASVLAEHWKTIEGSYEAACQFFFRMSRQERENIIRFLFQIRVNFKEFLQRPDHKQEFITQWQKDFNDIAGDIREDEEMKMELHQRVDDMRERLWNICDERKIQAENEREAIMADGWLDDQQGLLTNFYITLIQAELDRFQDSAHLIKDYYQAMEDKSPVDISEDYGRLGLIELGADVESSTAMNVADSVIIGDQNAALANEEVLSKDTASKDTIKGHQSRQMNKSRTPSSKKRDRSKDKKSDEKNKSDVALIPSAVIGKRVKIPIVPRVPPSPESFKKDRKSKKEDASTMESPPSQLETDEKLLFEAATTSYHLIDSIVGQHTHVCDAEIQAERKAELEYIKDWEAKNKSGKKKSKSRSPSAAKGKKEDTGPEDSPPPYFDTLSDAEKAVKVFKDKKRQESTYALLQEARDTKVRIELIKGKAFNILQDLRLKTADVFKDMQDWLGERFTQEMESIDHISEVIQYCIERGEIIPEQIVLEQDKFIIRQDLSMTKKDQPDTLTYPIEYPMVDLFTVSQITDIFKQFEATAPSGVMSVKAFSDTFDNIVSVSQGMENIPDLWMSISPEQFAKITQHLSGETDFVVWRRFILSLLSPLPTPTLKQLLTTLEEFSQMDQCNTGYVTREQYNLMSLWFTTIPPFVIPDENGLHGPFDRLGRLRLLLFDIFSDFTREPPELDYLSFLLFFCAVDKPEVGLSRAIALVTHSTKSESEICFFVSNIVSSQLEVTDVELPQISKKYKEDIPLEALDATVPLHSLYRVLHHGEKLVGDSHRFCFMGDSEESRSLEKLTNVYEELNSDPEEGIKYRYLMDHPVVQDLFSSCHLYHILNLKDFISYEQKDNSTILE